MKKKKKFWKKKNYFWKKNIKMIKMKRQCKYLNLMRNYSI